MATTWLNVLVWLIGFAIVFGVIFYAMRLLTIPDPIRQIVLLVLGGIGLILLLEKLVPLLAHLGMVVI